MPQSGRGGRVQKPAEPERVRFSRQPDVRSELPKLVYELLSICEGFCEAGPDPRRVDLRDLKGRLRAMYPKVFRMSQIDLLQELAEQDGEEIQE